MANTRSKASTRAAVQDSNVLDLDQMFGTRTPIRVKIFGRTWDLQPPDAFGPRQLNRLTYLYKRIGEIQAMPDEMTAELSGELEELALEELELACPELAKKKPPFLAVMAILQFYSKEIEARQGESKNPMAATSDGIGAPSTVA